jgi:predicted transposase
MQITVKSELLIAEEDKSKLDNLMRIYSSAHRFAYNRLMDDDLSKNNLKKLIQEMFGLNARYSYASMVDADAIMDSQKELLPIYLGEVKSKVKKAKKDFKKVKNPVKIKRLEDRIRKLEKKKKYYYLCYITKHTVPRTIFGGKNNLKKLNEGKITKEEWKDIRSNQVYSIGGKIDGGNQNIQLIREESESKMETEIEEGKFPIRIRINVDNRKWIYGDIKVSDRSPYHIYL